MHSMPHRMGKQLYNIGVAGGMRDGDHVGWAIKIEPRWEV